MSMQRDVGAKPLSGHARRISGGADVALAHHLRRRAGIRETFLEAAQRSFVRQPGFWAVLGVRDRRSSEREIALGLWRVERGGGARRSSCHGGG